MHPYAGSYAGHHCPEHICPVRSDTFGRFTVYANGEHNGVFFPEMLPPNPKRHKKICGNNCKVNMRIKDPQHLFAYNSIGQILVYISPATGQKNNDLTYDLRDHQHNIIPECLT